MRLSSGLREFVELLNSRGVDYLIVGAYSLAFHARPRYTGDLDILVRPTSANAAKLTRILEDFGFGAMNIQPEDLLQPDTVIQLGRPPHRIDLLTSISGVPVEDAFADRVASTLDA